MALFFGLSYEDVGISAYPCWDAPPSVTDSSSSGCSGYSRICVDFQVFLTICSMAVINIVLITFVLCEMFALFINLAAAGASVNLLVKRECSTENTLAGLGAGGIIACVLHIIVIVLTCLGPARRTHSILTVTQDGSTLVDVGSQPAEAYRGAAGSSASSTPVPLLQPLMQ